MNEPQLAACFELDPDEREREDDKRDREDEAAMDADEDERLPSWYRQEPDIREAY